MNPFFIGQIIDHAILFARVHKKALLAATAAIALFGAGFATATKFEASKDTKVATAQVRTVVKEVIKRDEVERKVYVQDLATVRRLEAEKQALRTQIADLQEKVPEYVPEIPTSPYLSRGAVSLLDAAASGRDPAPATSPSGVPAFQDTGPSDVTWRELVFSDLEARGRYRDAQRQCNALIDWVEFNVVNKQ